MIFSPLIFALFLCRPNLCRTDKVYETQKFLYTYQQYCWKFGFFERCKLYCTRNDECDGVFVNVTKSYVDCCDGFAVDPAQSRSGYGGKSRHRRHGLSYSSFKTNGCPIGMC